MGVIFLKPIRIFQVTLLWIGLIAFLISLITLIIGNKKHNRKMMKYSSIVLVISIVVIGGSVILANHLFSLGYR